MKKILLSVSIIAAIGAVVFGVTTAFFSDTETSTGNTFTAGSIDLQVDSQCTYNGATSNQCGTWQLKDLVPTSDKFFNFTDIKPGDSGENTISLHVINNDAWVCAEVSNLTDFENGQTEPEALVDTTTGANQGELSQVMVWTVWRDTNCDNIQNNGEVTLTSGHPVNGVLPVYDSTTGAALPGGSTSCLGVSWSLPSATGNEVQTDGMTGDISFHVEQARNNSDFRCSQSTIPSLVFLDDFNDGNADGWLSGRSCNAPSWCGLGNYRVENGQVTQDQGGDGYVFLFDGHPMTNQSVEARVLWHDNGGAGLAVWRYNEDNWVYVSFPVNSGIAVSEKWCNASPPCGRDDNTTSVTYPYPHQFVQAEWHMLRIDTNSLTGKISVYMDGEYLFTHTVGTNTHRSGLSGFVSGNAGGSFDDFKLISN